MHSRRQKSQRTEDHRQASTDGHRPKSKQDQCEGDGKGSDELTVQDRRNGRHGLCQEHHGRTHGRPSVAAWTHRFDGRTDQRRKSEHRQRNQHARVIPDLKHLANVRHSIARKISEATTNAAGQSTSALNRSWRVLSRNLARRKSDRAQTAAGSASQTADQIHDSSSKSPPYRPLIMSDGGVT